MIWGPIHILLKVQNLDEKLEINKTDFEFLKNEKFLKQLSFYVKEFADKMWPFGIVWTIYNRDLFKRFKSRMSC